MSEIYSVYSFFFYFFYLFIVVQELLRLKKHLLLLSMLKTYILIFNFSEFLHRDSFIKVEKKSSYLQYKSFVAL